ncbi:MAG: hypothetical protein RQ862_10755 [Candidatus Caldarchaeales archaeon]|jgi:hypothetical protein|nr:hypothetical protein [Candidatus Caldarchaeales archaeon]
MKGRRRQKAYEYFKWVKEVEEEVKKLEDLWELGIIGWRDQKRYLNEIEPFFTSDLEFRLDAVRIIR